MEIINPWSRDLIKVSTELASKPLSLEINRLAFRATSAVLATWGETVVLATIQLGDKENSGLDYFPLSVDYEERFYAAGKISGSRYIKREGRPSDDAILTGRLIDRPIRPLFPKSYRRAVQVVTTVLSLDPECPADSLGTIAASAALSLAPVPFAGPIAGIRVAQIDGQLKIGLSNEDRDQADLNLMVSSNDRGIMMVEAAANETSNQVVIDALKMAHETNQIAIKLQRDLQAAAKVTTPDYQEPDQKQAVKQVVTSWWDKQKQQGANLKGEYSQQQEKRFALHQKFDQEIAEQVGESEWLSHESDYQQAFEVALDQEVRRQIVENGERLDGRQLDEVRSLSSQISVLPRTHGSAIFTRGATQALNIVTLAPLSLSQSIDTMERNGEKRYFHHYNAPGYTVGELKRMMGPGRREIGHSYLAERALLPVLPNEQDFPYAIRSVTEIMSQHGSTSMAATCSSCLALMDAGVPIQAPVSGVAMGLIMNGDQPIILTDIQDSEDFAGDMDFKVTGTAKGITACQMDMKVPGLPVDILAQALEAATAGRAKILDHMLSVIGQPKDDLSPHAPRVISLMIPTDKIRNVIGKGGETIQGLVAETNSQIDVKDDGQVLIFSPDLANLEKAKARILELTANPEVGKIYVDRPVVKVADFGAFINILPGRDGMVHVSEINDQRVEHPGDILKVGDLVTVKLVSIDDRGRLSLSIRQAATKV